MSGSTALLDLLSEYCSISRVPGEFDDFRRSGLFGDVLEGYASFPDDRQINFALRDFKGVSPFVKAGVRQRLHFKFEKFGSLIYKSKKIERVERFYEALKLCSCSDHEKAVRSIRKYISWVAKEECGDRNLKILFQPIFLGIHENFWPKCFHPFKIIFVIRNPIDQLGELSEWSYSRLEMDTPIRSLLSMYGQDQDGLMKFHSDAIFSRLQHMERIQKELGDEKALTLKFEDLVFNYQETKSKIENFLELSPSHHLNPTQIFNPDVSKNNIGLGVTKLSTEALEVVKKRFSLE